MPLLRTSIVRAPSAGCALVLAGLLAAPSARAGDLEPPGPPGPTMKTLLQIPPTWSHRLDATNGDADGCNSSRFNCNVVGVLDNETGLVWERTPNLNGFVLWETALGRCANLTTGQRGGWRLPTLPELSSLFLSLPPEAPFNFSQGRYWTMTTDGVNILRAWAVATNGVLAERRAKSQIHRVWCVRSAAPLSFY
jgi:hypothetical protein